MNSDQFSHALGVIAFVGTILVLGLLPSIIVAVKYGSALTRCHKAGMSIEECARINGWITTAVYDSKNKDEQQ